MKRISATIALGLVVLGCGRLPDPVQLVTGTSALEPNGCFAFDVAGRLTVDPSYGTAIIVKDGTGGIPVAWRPGFTGRRAGSEVEVLDPDGKVVATTGRPYDVEGGYVTDGSWGHPETSMFWACGYVKPLPFVAPIG
jgi:hypothetical protein